MTPEARTAYIVSCIREAGAMYAQDAAAFLAEHDTHRRTEVLTEAADVAEHFTERWPDVEAMKADGIIGPFTAWGRLAEELRRMAGAVQDGKGTREGELTRPAVSPQVWHVYEEDAPAPARPRLFTTKAAAEQGTIDLYREMGNSCPDYSWQPDEDIPGAHELVAGGEPVGIYLAPVPVGDTRPDLSAPAPDFFQPGRTYTHRDGTTFQCITVTTTPWNGQRLAIGWHTDETDITSISWRGIGEWRNDYDGRKPVHGPSVPGTCARARATYDWVYGTTPTRETPCRPYPEQLCVVTCRITEGEVPRG
jgi:hypothetical protein